MLVISGINYFNMGGFVMKQYHEIASVINNAGKLEGFYLVDSFTGGYRYTDLNEFYNLVHAEKVQYFVLDEYHWLKIQYSDEELKAIGKAAKMVGRFQELDDYLKNDVKILKQYLDLAQKHQEICTGWAVATPKLPLVGSALNIAILHSGKGTDILKTRLEKTKAVRALVQDVLCLKTLIVTIPLVTKIDYLKDVVPFFSNCLISTCALDNPPEIAAAENIKNYNILTSVLYKKGADKAELKAMKQLVDNINNNTLNQYTSSPSGAAAMSIF